VAVQLYATRPPLDRLGLAFLNGSSPPVTIISVSLDYTGGDRGLAIERYDQTWRTVNETTKFKLPPRTWYTLTIRWEAPTLTAFVYNSSGALRAQLGASIGDFTARYIALIVDGKGEGYFDNFVISSQDLQYVQVSGLEQGWRVELYSGDTLIGSAVADASGVAQVTVVTDLIVVNARIVVKDSTGNVVIKKAFTEIVGGDEYTYGS